MDIVLLPPHIIQRIFDFLKPQDVYQCRYVCKTFYRETSRWLTRCPPIDAFQSVVRLIEMNNVTLFKRRTKRNEKTEMKVIMENEKMNGSFRAFLHQPAPLGWWYLRRRDNFRHLPRPEVDKALKSFVQQDMDCLPSFSFVHADYHLEDLIYSSSFRYPTIALIQSSNVRLELDDEIFRTPLHSLLDIPEDSHLSKHAKPFIEPYIEAIHINRFASDHKVIITNWSDPESIRPNLDDPEYPVKAFILFAVVLLNDVEHDFEEVDRFLEEFNFPVMSSGSGYFSIFYANPSEGLSLSESPLISVAFVGKQIKAAMHVFQEFANELEFLQEVIEFKNHLDFQTDDGRVLGFLADAADRIDSPLGKHANKLIEIFESVKFVNLPIIHVPNHKFGSNHPAMLLIRI
ncbi:uncharacterized protein LOC141849883 [Brevipalpus obovatus]|uniref:uncharacterized protein LOC141849883 n=1 Tax=Brevipalpus obovatus TaxID=246614 RepID=UPI003D9EDE2F